MTDPRHVIVQGVRVPTLIYGTAWKEGETQRLTSQALAAGFRGIDTANQRKHYHEAGVGAALAAARERGSPPRAELFVQTKFTFLDGQDERLPYDRAAPIPEQVRQSFESSLNHLGVERLDSYVLHGPSRRHGLGDSDWQAWSAMEALQRAGKARLLGVSNVTLGQLEELHAAAALKPALVQNRCYATTGWDEAVRAFCAEHGMLYQGFSLLTANREVLRHRRVQRLAAGLGRTVEEVVLRFALQVGMAALTGTTSLEHMRQDLSIYDFELEPDAVSDLERLAMS